MRTAPATPARSKLSYKEQRELETLPQLIAQLEAAQKTITEKLADPDLYKKEPAVSQQLNKRFAEIDTLLLDYLERWEAIEVRGK